MVYLVLCTLEHIQCVNMTIKETNGTISLDLADKSYTGTSLNNLTWYDLWNQVAAYKTDLLSTK